MDRQQLLLGGGLGHVELRKRPAQPRHVAREVDEPAVDDAGDLVDGVGHEEAAVEHRDAGLAFEEVVAVDIDRAAHAHPQSPASGGCTPFSS